MKYQLTTVFDQIVQAYLAGKRTIVNEGGTSSSKTISTIQFLIFFCTNCKDPVLVSTVSESYPHLRRGCIRDFQNIMGDNFDNEAWNKSESTYDFGNNRKIEFFSADNSSKLRGGRRDILFINEANNISKESFDELDVRTRWFTIVDFNPVEEFYIHEMRGREEIAWIHSTFLDAAHVLEQSVIDNILSRKERDPNWWHVYGLGLVGKIEGLVHPLFQQCEELPAGGRELYGLDFGYAFDPAVLVRNKVIDDSVYSEELIYETGLTNAQLSKRMDAAGIRKNYDVIIADCAEPKSIQELHLMGWDIRACSKGEDSLRNGIQRVNQYKQFWTKNSLNCIKEQRNYRYEKDKDGKYTSKPIDDFNHGMDARRYPLSTIPEAKVIQMRVPSSNFTVDFKKLTVNSTLLVSVWTEKSLRTSALMCLWSATAANLYVFFEQSFETPQPERLVVMLSNAINVLSDGEIKGLKLFEVWGNDEFFGEFGGDLSTAFQNLSGVYVRQNKNYNEIGAITMASKMLNNRQIIIQSRCGELLRQMSQWRIVGKPEDGHGLARALLSIISTLQESGKLINVMKKIPEYSKKRLEVNKHIQDIVNQGLRGKKPQQVSKNAWMAV